MASLSDKNSQILIAADKFFRRKANSLGSGGNVFSEQFNREFFLPKDHVFRFTPTANTNFAVPDYADFPGTGAVATRNTNFRLHPVLTSGLSGPQSIQSFLTISGAPTDDSTLAINAVRIKAIIPPDFSPQRTNAAEPAGSLRGFELALYPAKSNGGFGNALVADTSKGPIPITADPSAPYGIGDGYGYWSVDYDNGLVHFNVPPLNGSTGLMNPNNVYADINGIQVDPIANPTTARLTMFATYYYYTGILENNQNLEFVTVGDGVQSFGFHNGVDENAVLAAFNDLGPNGGTIVIKPGNYTYLNPVTIPSNISILGDGYAGIMKPTGQAAFIINGSNIKVQGLTIHSVGSTSTACILVRSPGASQTLENIYINNNKLYSNSSNSCLDIGSNFSGVTIKNIHVDRNLFTYEVGASPIVYISNSGSSSATLTDCTISDNYFDSTSSSQIIISTSWTSIGNLNVDRNYASGSVVTISPTSLSSLAVNENSFSSLTVSPTSCTGVHINANSLSTLSVLPSSGSNVFINKNYISTVSGMSISSGITEAYIDGNNVAGVFQIGLGTPSPQNNLDIVGNAAFGTYAGVFAAPSGGLIVSGNVGIGINNPGTNALYVNGTTQIAGITGINTAPVSGVELAVQIPSLGNTVGTTQNPLRLIINDGNGTDLYFQTFRHQNGSDWQTADQYIGKKVDFTYQGFLGFYSTSGKAGAQGIGLGYASNTTSFDSVSPTLFVNTSQVGIGTTAPSSKLVVDTTGLSPSAGAFIGPSALGTSAGDTGQLQVIRARFDTNTTFGGQIGVGHFLSDGSNSITQNMALGRLMFGGLVGANSTFNQSNMYYTANIAAYADQTWSANTSTGTYLTFSTTQNTSGVAAGGFDTVNNNNAWGTERMRIESSGRIAVGLTSANGAALAVNSDNAIAPATGGFVLQGGASAFTRMEIRAFGTNPAPVFQGVGGGGTVGTPTQTLTGSTLASLRGRGVDDVGAITNSSALINFIAANNWTTATPSHGSYIQFQTTPIGSITVAEVMRIENNGNVGIGTTVPNAKLEVFGGQFTSPNTPQTSEVQRWSVKEFDNTSTFLRTIFSQSATAPLVPGPYDTTDDIYIERSSTTNGLQGYIGFFGTNSYTGIGLGYTRGSGNGPKIFINSSGNIGFNTPSPNDIASLFVTYQANQAFSVFSNDGSRVRLSSTFASSAYNPLTQGPPSGGAPGDAGLFFTSNGFVLAPTSASAFGIRIDNNGHVGINISNPGTFALNVNGTTNISGNTTIGGTLNVTGTTTITGPLVLQNAVSAGTFLAGPIFTSGSGAPSFRQIATLDEPKRGYEIFGDGSDGNVTISTGTTMTRDMYYNNLTIVSGGSLFTNGYRLFVAGILNLNTAPANAIQINGNPGQANNSHGVNAGGAGVQGNTLGGSGAGGAGGQSSTSSSFPGTNGGGLTGNGSSGGQGAVSFNTGAPGSGGVTSLFPLRRITPEIIGYISGGITVIGGGAGGGGGGSGVPSGSNFNTGGTGGGGGSGGGAIAIFARTISRGGSTAASAISCVGGHGGQGDSAGGVSNSSTAGSGGGGGGGGWVYIVVENLTGSTATNCIDVSGGAGGNGAFGGTGSPNVLSGGGYSGFGGVVRIFNLSAGTWSETSFAGVQNPGQGGGFNISQPQGGASTNSKVSL